MVRIGSTELKKEKLTNMNYFDDVKNKTKNANQSKAKNHNYRFPASLCRH